MLNAVNNLLADTSSVSPSSEQRVTALTPEELTLETSANKLFTAFNILTSTSRRYIVRFTATPTQTKLKWSSQGLVFHSAKEISF